MLIDTSVTFAYKCSSCGTFDFFNISVFNLLFKKECILNCRCNNSSIIITWENSRHFKVKAPCIGCGSDHAFVLGRKEILSGDIKVFYCPETGIKLCFIGNDEEVRRKIDNLEKELDDLINLFGYDNYFKNTQVMFDSLNKIHDIAEQGNLYCKCGNDDIELILLSNKIHLRCTKCSGKKVIFAASNKDLKYLLTKKQILLVGGDSDYCLRPLKTLMSKTDNK